MKGQSLVYQFVLFFLIGFTIFLAVGNLFKTQSEVFKEDTTALNAKLTNNYLSSAIILAANTCKQCNFVNLTLTVPKTYSRYYQEVQLSNAGLNVSIGNKNFMSSAHNLNSTLFFQGKGTSAQPITLTYDKNKNKIEVS